jgi:Holliday junction resolvasome RuvABC endonuclease subunit
MSRTVLALDLGTTTGWALSSNGEIQSGTISFKDTRFDSKDSRFTKFFRWLQNKKAHYDIESIVYECVTMLPKSSASAHCYGGFMGAVQMFGDKYEIPYEGVPVGTIKKYISGKGNASKEDVIREVTLLGHQPKDDNEADALALLYWRMRQEADPC